MHRKAAAKQKKDVKECLKLLETGKLQLGDVECIAEEIKSKPEIGDTIQYELHKYCKGDVLKTNTELIVKLSELCYTEESVLCFSNISRFVGCVFHISSHLLKKERYQSALSILSSLLIRKKEIVECGKQKSDVRSFICILHTIFIASAVGLASKVKSTSDGNYKLCHRLSMESLNVLKLTTTEQPEVGRKVLKTTALYLQSLKHYKDEDIADFYLTLREVLKTLFPLLGSLDYFWYFLAKMSQIKKPDSDAEVEQMMRKFVDLLVIFQKSPPTERDAFVKIVDFFWVNFHEDKWISDEEFRLISENPSHMYLNFLLLSIIFNNGVQFLWAKYEKSWSTNVSVAALQKVSTAIISLHTSLLGCREFYCSPFKAPFEACYGDLLTGNLHKIQYTVRLCLKNKLPEALSLVSVSRQAFRLGLKSLEKMKHGCCEKLRANSWKVSVIHHTNTVEDICRLAPSDTGWFFLKEFSRDVLQEVVNSNMELPFDFARIKILFQRWHTGSLKLGNYQQSLHACVTYYVFYPAEERDIMSMWIQTKSESSNEIIQEITMADMLKTSEQTLREFNSSYNSSNVCFKSALLMELKAYSSCPPDTFQNPNTAFSLATRIWKQLDKMKLDLWESSVAMSSLILASLAGEIEKLPNGFHEKYQKLIDAFMSQRQEEKLRCRSLLHAANLNFSRFLYNVSTSEASEGKMDTSQMVLGHLKKEEEEKVKLGEDVDLNLTCDVLPSSRRLTVELETNYFNELNRIVDLWGDALKQGGHGLPLASEFDAWLRNVKQAANMYEMFGEYRRALTTWLMYYGIGKLCKDSRASLLGLSHLIRATSDVDASGMKGEAMLVSENLDSEAAEEVLVEYALAMAANYLKNKKPVKCLEHLSRAKKTLEVLPTAIKTYTLNARFWCLVSQFLVVYKEYEAVFEYPVGTDVRVFAFKAFSYANSGIKSELIKSATRLESTEHVLALLEVNLWAYHLHRVYRQTDFMRFFLDDVYQIVQRLFLPTRTAEMLARLAEVDIICEKGPDCQEKVNKLKSILTTRSSTGSKTAKVEKPTSPYLKVPEQGKFDSASTRPISPVRFINKRTQAKDLDLSPIQQYLKVATTPKAPEHEKKCKCRLCQNLLIQTLTMQTAWLEAEIHSLRESKKEAAGCYGQACEVLNRLEHLAAEQSKILQLEVASRLKEDPGEMDLRLGFIQFHGASFLIQLALFESSNLNSVTENVAKTIQRVTKLLNNLSYEEKLLRWTFTELKLFCVLLDKQTTKTPKRRTPSLKGAAAAVTPVAGAPPGRTPVVGKSGPKVGKSPRPCAEGVASGGSKRPGLDPLNTAFVEMHDAKTKKQLIRPRKLNFQTSEAETSAKTVRKACKDSVASIPSRKLNFDLSGDLFEEPAAPPRTTRTATTTTKKPAARSSVTAKPRRKDAADSVKIYVDGKNDGSKPKKSQSAKPRKVDIK